MYLTIISLTFLCLSNSVIINLQQKGYFFEYPSSSWEVYIPPHFVFSSYDQVFRTYPAGQSEVTAL